MLWAQLKVALYAKRWLIRTRARKRLRESQAPGWTPVPLNTAPSAGSSRRTTSARTRHKDKPLSETVAGKAVTKWLQVPHLADTSDGIVGICT